MEDDGIGLVLENADCNCDPQPKTGHRFGSRCRIAGTNLRTHPTKTCEGRISSMRQVPATWLRRLPAEPSVLNVMAKAGRRTRRQQCCSEPLPWSGYWA